MPRNTLPDQAYGPVSIFYRDDRGNVARLNGVARYGALIGRDRSVTFAVDNPRGEQVCEGTFTNDGPATGRFSLSAASAASSAATAPTRARPARPTTTSSPAARPARGQPVSMVIGLPAQLAGGTLWRHLTCAAWLLLALVALAPAVALAQSAGEVERCFQNPGSLLVGAAAAERRARRRSGGGAGRGDRGRPRRRRTTRRCCRAPIPIGGKLQESLRTLDKYNGPIDGNLQSEATTKAISDWQKGHGLNAVGKLTPQRGAAAQHRGGQGADPAPRSARRRRAAAPTPSPPSPTPMR